MVTEIESYIVKNSRTNHKIPVVNGVHLHSAYNPIREAESLASSNIELIKEKKAILILGLAFGYHVNQIIVDMRKIHGTDFQIIVIEPSQQVATDCQANGHLLKDNMTIYAGLKAKKLYNDPDFISFLQKSPGIITHAASFNLYKSYFTTILSYEAPNNIENVKEVISDKQVRHHLQTLPANMTLNSALENQQRNRAPLDDELSFLFMAFKKLGHQTGEANNG